VAEVRQSESSEAARAASERIRLLEADLLNAQKAASDAVLGAEKSEKRAVAAEQIAGAKERRCQELQREVDKAVEECAKQELSHGSSEALKAERESSALLKQELEHARQVASDATKAAQRAEAAKQGLESDNRVLASGMEELARDVELAAEQIAELKQSAEHAARDAAMEIEQLKAQVAELNEQLEQATAPSRQSRKQGARVAAKD
jgi:chromosome segregation ATPase